MLPYIALLLPIAIGFLTNNAWAGVLLGLGLWWACRQTGTKQQPEDQEELQQKLEKVQNELTAVQARVLYLEQQMLQHAWTASREPSAASSAPESAEQPPLPEVAPAPAMPCAEAPGVLAASDMAAAQAAPLAAEMPQEILSDLYLDEQTGAQYELPAVPEAVVQPPPLPSAAPVVQKTAFEQESKEKKEHVLHTLLNWFVGGNVLLKTGVVILFFGLAFLLRLAAEHIEVSVKARYVMVALAGLGATVAGWWLRSKRREYGLVLQGFGIAVMYLTALAALKLHPLLPAAVTFGIMVALVILMAALAIRQNAPVLAQVALLGGMAAPVLVSDGSGRHLVLFSYLALLNTGVAAIAWFKAWRSLNLIGFAGTFLIGGMWGARSYTTAHFATTEPFLLYHWLLYTVIACLFARRRLASQADEACWPALPDNASLERIWRNICAHGVRVGLVDGTLLFGTALAAFGMQHQMVSVWAHAAAWAALGFAVVYGLFAWLITRWGAAFVVLKQAFVMLAFVFMVLAVPLAFKQQWTAGVWTLQATLVYVLGSRQKQPHVRFMALLVYALAACAQLGTYRPGEASLLQGSLLGTLLTAAGGIAMYAQWWKKQRNGSALWEQNGQVGVLLAVVLHVSLAPLLVFAERGSMVALAVLAVVWAFCQRKQAQWVFCAASVLSGATVLFWALTLATRHTAGQQALYWLFALCAILLAVAAYFMHKADWLNRRNNRQDECAGTDLDSITRLNTLLGWALLVMALMQGLGGAWMGLSELARAVVADADDKRFLVWSLVLVFAPLAWLGVRTSWQQAQRAALAFTPLFALLFLVYQWGDAPLAGALVLVAATALHGYVLWRQALTAHTNGTQAYVLPFHRLFVVGGHMDTVEWPNG